MRKYFLATAVALLAVTNVNAENISKTATVDVNATISYADNITCTALSFGNIIVDSSLLTDGTKTATVTLDEDNSFNVTKSDLVLNVSDTSPAKCSSNNLRDYADFPEQVTLTNTKGHELIVDDFAWAWSGEDTFGATLHLANMNDEKAFGTYNGSCTVTFTF